MIILHDGADDHGRDDGDAEPERKLRDVRNECEKERAREQKVEGQRWSGKNRRLRLPRKQD